MQSCPQYQNLTGEERYGCDERELYFTHTLDVAWTLALWHSPKVGQTGMTLKRGKPDE
jgi:hypothetical protein